MDLPTVIDMLKELIAPTMAAIPITLNVIGYIIKRVPQIPDWTIPIVLWGFGIVFGFAYQTWDAAIAPSVAGALVQGTLSTGLAIAYFQTWKQLLERKA